jgi:ATP-dependent DNA helicase RecG
VPLELSTPVKYIKRVGDRVAAGLSERGVITVEDLLYHLPFRYEDRLHPRPLSSYNPGDMASLIGEVRGTILLRTRSGPMFEMTVGITPPPADSEEAMQGLLTAPSGLILETVKCLWFHGAYLKDKFHAGQRLALYGKLEGSRSGNALNAPPGATKFKLIQPTFEILPDPHSTGEDAEFTMLEMGRIVPIYESLGGKTPWGAKLTSRWHRRVLWTVFRDLAEAAESIPQPTPNSPGAPSSPMASSSVRVGSQALNPATDPPTQTPETLPLALLQRLGFPTRLDSFQHIHFPSAGTPLEDLQTARTPAHRRLIFEEFFYLELGLELKRRRLRDRNGPALTTSPQVREALKQILPFKPTTAQKRVLGEIVTDMRRSQPMRRLLQGDVGSGKTIVAFQAALVAIENGFQVALMAPTEILATQHFLSARRLLTGKLSPRTARPYRIALLTGSLDPRSKRETRNRIARGDVDLAIGTHALVEEKVDFDNLGLVIVDEQHRFGVQQRFQLMRKQPPATNSGAPSSPTADPGSPASAFARRGGSSSARVGPHTPDAPTEPHVLVMTATPIPRTLALTVYGDMEASIIDELPPGRTPIATRRMPEERSPEVWDFLRKQVAAGRQAYIVYPVIEGEKDDQPELDFALDPSDLPARSDIPATSTGKSPATSDSATTPTGTSPATSDLPATSTGTSPANKTSAANKTSPASNPEPRTSASAKSASHHSPARRAGLSGPAQQRAESPTQTPTPKSRKKPTRPKLRSATEMHAELSTGPLAGLRLGLLHGRMSPDDKEVTMARFKRGELDVLVATTVIEVGVDVPNATVMVIEHAERFGLAQMHQLRGRVGRGAAKSFCILLTGAQVSPEAELRLDAMTQTQDGFLLAELDLQQRGPGEFFGTRQAGLPDLRIANLARDRDLLELAKREAAAFVHTPDPAIPRHEREAVWARLKLHWQRRYGLVEA